MYQKTRKRVKNFAMILIFASVFGITSCARTVISDFCLRYKPVYTVEGIHVPEGVQEQIDENNAIYYEHCL